MVYGQPQPSIQSERAQTSVTQTRRKPSTGKVKKPASAGKRRKAQPNQANSVMMNNFFPALNAEGQAINPEEGMQQDQDQFGDNMQLINEVPIEEEEGESQDVTHARKQQQYASSNDADQEQHEELQINPMLSDEQLVELLQNAGQLTAKQQEQLQALLRQRMKKDVKSQKKQQYSNIYKILTENVAKAKKRLAALGNDQPRNRAANREDQETFERML